MNRTFYFYKIFLKKTKKHAKSCKQYLLGYNFCALRAFYTRKGVEHGFFDKFIPDRVLVTMETISEFLKRKRKETGLTQEEFALRSGLGLRFVRELEQGKKSCRTDKVNQALEMFGCCLGVVRLERKNEEGDQK